MYLGVYKFLRFRTEVHVNSRDELPQTLTEGDVDQLINDDEILPIWDNFKRELHEDNERFFQCYIAIMEFVPVTLCFMNMKIIYTVTRSIKGPLIQSGSFGEKYF